MCPVSLEVPKSHRIETHTAEEGEGRAAVAYDLNRLLVESWMQTAWQKYRTPLVTSQTNYGNDDYDVDDAGDDRDGDDADDGDDKTSRRASCCLALLGLKRGICLNS